MSSKTTARAGLAIAAGSLTTVFMSAGVAAAGQLPPLPTPTPLPLPTTPAPVAPSPSDAPSVPLPTEAPRLPGNPAPAPEAPGSDGPVDSPDGGTTTEPKSKPQPSPTRRAPTDVELAKAGGFGYAAPPSFGGLQGSSGYLDSGMPGLAMHAAWAVAPPAAGTAPITAGQPTATDTSVLAAGLQSPIGPDQRRNLMVAVAFVMVAGVATAHFKIAETTTPAKHRVTSR